MGITANSLASGVGVGFENVIHSPKVTRLERKPVIVGTYDPSKTAIIEEEPIVVSSAEDAGSKLGFGFPIHRLTRAFFRQYPGFRVTLVPQAEVVGGVQATGTISITGTSTEAGELSLFIAGDYVPVTVPNATAGAAIAILIAAAINADKNLPITAAVDGETDTQVNITAKDSSTFGNGVTMEHSLFVGQKIPAGLTVAIVDMADGAGVPDIQDALDALGVNDQQNMNFYTGGVHSYGQHAATLNVISTYNGIGNEKVGNFKNTVARPFQFITGDTVADGDDGLDDLIVLGDSRKTDRTNCCIAVPGSPNHPSEIAAVALAIRESTAIERPESTYVNKIMNGVIPGIDGTRWTDDYDTGCDSAVKAGISTTDILNGNVVIKDLITFYHPDDLPDENNIYRSMRNNAITQNICNAVKKLFGLDKWTNITIVSDVNMVTDDIAKQKVRDIYSVAAALCKLANDMMGLGWLFDAGWTKETILGDLNSYISIREGGKGFDNILPVSYSGEGGIINTNVKADISLAVFTG
jgi:phage tail sheath gpL-like